MWLSDRRKFLGLLAALAGTSCGFVPAYGPGGPAQDLLGKVMVDDPDDKNSFDFVGRLEERLGRAEGAAYRLSYSISTATVALGISRSNVITRYNVTGTITYALRHILTDAVLASGSVRNFTSYSASGTVVSTAASERDAYLRLMRILADQIMTELVAASTSWPGQ